MLPTFARPACDAAPMELDALLVAMDNTAVNLDRLEAVWNRAQPMLPTGPSLGGSTEYDDLARAWHDLLAGLPPIEGWTITEDLPDIEGLGQDFLDYADIDEIPHTAWEARERPGKDLATYRYRLTRARRRAARDRLRELTTAVDSAVALISADINPDLDPDVDLRGATRIERAEVDQVTSALDEIERLVGDTITRRGRWSEMRRHLRFGQAHDWNDIAREDWPSIKPDIEAAGFSETEPLPVPDIDLGTAAASTLTGHATVALAWERLTPEQLERLLFDLLNALRDYENVQWLQKTNATDHGRDLSCERVLRDSSGSMRTERVIVQVKHRLSRSIAPLQVHETLAALEAAPPPRRQVLIIATSGHFTAGALTLIEQRTEIGQRPDVEMWSSSKLESLLAQHPQIAAAHGLR